MIILPAIDIIGGKAVRLLKGDYNMKTVYGDNPAEIALDFKAKGAEFIHIVDLDGAKSGSTDNLEVICDIINTTNLKCEIGGGIRDIKTVDKYVSLGAARVILGTAAVKDPQFLENAVKTYGERIAVGVDLSNGLVAVNGWTQTTELRAFDFVKQMENIGVKTIICTDISKDGAMQGTNTALYKELSQKTKINLIASGGVSSLDDVKSLKEIGIYGAIIGKAYYTGAIDIKAAIEVAK